MKVLVVGGGGREHAILWKIVQSPKVDKLYCAPGNGGIEEIATCININATDIEGIVDFAVKEAIDLTVVAPDDPLALGLVNALEEKGLRAFGPNKKAAIIESSKVFAKNLMKKYGIPTADYEVFDDVLKAKEYILSRHFPIVIKAEGLALGKGVVIAYNVDEAMDAVERMMVEKVFKDAGNRIVIEEFLTGPEVSVLTFTDGKTIIPMVSAQDHKRALENDKGPNTGGMGAFSPSLHYTKDIASTVMNKILQPTVDAMAQEGRPFKGVLYFGLILTEEGPKVLEYNARFGDPETQVILPRLKTDLVEIMEAVIDERLEEVTIEWDNRSVVCVVLASGGYPGKYVSGYEISGLDELKNMQDIIVFHSGTKKANEKYYTSGGRVLGVTSTADKMEDAIKLAYQAVSKVHFHNVHYRRDIGRK